jgi:tagatose 1,6-diphosphate aldolase
LSFLPGTRRGLDACASPRGTFAVLALDHRQNLRAELHPDEPAATTFDEMVAFKRAVVRALAPVATGTLLDPEVGAAQSIADGSLPGNAGLIVAVEATGFEGPPQARISRALPGWSVEQAKRMGASAVKLLLYYHPAAATADAQERLLARVAAESMRLDIPLFVEPLGYDPATGGRLAGEARRECVVETARRLTQIGGTVLKTEFPYDAGISDRVAWEAACRELDAASAMPWVLLSGGVDDATFESQASAACRAGASGVLVGRSVWAPAARMAPAERDAWLTTEGRARLVALVRLVDDLGMPWHARPNALAAAAPPGEGWYREY